MEFEWDSIKAETNLHKHGISFQDAIKVFLDECRLEEDSTRPEHGEKRLKVIGMIDEALIVAVVYTQRNGRTHIISAPRARKDEPERYSQSQTTS
ncbi:MAG: BrnT family toxin [Brasilonema angustatum HA4187-MV1]|jgi:hypothetical protein|nr:BrnT family toxin [Brasilonema angustatum HA4187-MV1]